MSNQVSTITPQQQVIQVMQTPAFKEQLQANLPAHIKADAFMAVVRRGIQNNSALNWQTMDKNTLYASCLKAAEQGLKLDGEEAVLVQYGSNVQFMKMIKGVKIQLRNSGKIREISAEVVYENDKFEYWIDDLGKHIKHVPEFLKPRGKALAAYSVITTNDGGRYIKVMSEEQINAVKSASRSGNSANSPWNGAFKSEMWCKTVLRRNAKDAPTSTDLSDAFEDWDQDFEFNSGKQAQVATSTGASEDLSSYKTGKQKAGKRKSRLENIVAANSEDLDLQDEAQGPIDLTDNSPSMNQVDESDLPI